MILSHGIVPPLSRLGCHGLGGAFQHGTCCILLPQTGAKSLGNERESVLVSLHVPPCHKWGWKERLDEAYVPTSSSQVKGLKQETNPLRVLEGRFHLPVQWG